MTTAQNAAEPLARIRAASRFLRAVTTLGVIVIVGFYVAVAAVPAWFDPLITGSFQGLTMDTGITPIKRIGLLVLMAFPVAVMLYGIWHARRLFMSYEKGEIFTGRTAGHIRLVGLAMVISTALSVAVHTAGSVLLTYDNPPGSRALVVSLSGDTYSLLLAGGLLIVIGWVMREAARLSEENSQFI